MQMFSACLSPLFNPKPPLGLMVLALAAFQPLAEPDAAPADPSDVKPKGCGWFDSSFELQCGLEVSEQDTDTLYQLWQQVPQACDWQAV